MMRSAGYLLLLLVLFSSCMKEKKWDRHNIAVKLRAIFPNSAKVEVLDSTEYSTVRADTMNMPPPAYKALIKEEDLDSYSFILYFYNNGIGDTAVFRRVFSSFLITDLSAGLGTRKQEYVLALPLFNKSATKMVVYAVALGIPDGKHAADMEEKIIKVFDLQKIGFSGNMTDPAKESEQRRSKHADKKE
ncbi:MAG TPA: hypothetical protein VFI06_10745 [Chitinophagaceae bacterium]|nr:hypothetical protein [Chitinophagaceae bacterium]